MSEDDTFSAHCMKCDLRKDMKQRVSYTVLGLIITVTAIFVGLSYRGIETKFSTLSQQYNRIDNRIQVFTEALNDCNNRSLELSINQSNDRGMIRHLDKEIKELLKTLNLGDRSLQEYKWDEGRRP